MVRIVRCPAVARTVFSPRQLSGRDKWMDGIYSEGTSRRRRRSRKTVATVTITVAPPLLPISGGCSLLSSK